jgi:aspartyl-tRNA(Asn)/glutamyl-tRNA(Gln) amidotransferase subunit C
MDLTLNDIKNIADLARLELKNEEVSRLSQNMSSILDYVNILNTSVTNNGIEVANISGNLSIGRADEIGQSLKIEDVLLNAPASENGFIKVKNVLEGKKE